MAPLSPSASHTTSITWRSPSGAISGSGRLIISSYALDAAHDVVGLLEADVEAAPGELLELLHRRTGERGFNVYAFALEQALRLRDIQRPGNDAFGNDRQPYGLRRRLRVALHRLRGRA